MRNNFLYDLIIIGGGPAGLTAGIYAGRAKLKTLLLAGRVPGGQIYLTYHVENYPGFHDGITGPEIVERMISQVKRFGAEILEEVATKVDFASLPYRVYIGENFFETRAVIIATGSINRMIGLESERRLLGKGVFVCATCDAALYEDLRVVVVGGGESALQESLDLSRFANEVILVHRGNEFNASRYLVEQVQNNNKIVIMLGHTVDDIIGSDYVESVKLRIRETGEVKTLRTDGVLVAVGWIPNTELFRDELSLTEQGFIAADGVFTVKPGIFVAGDLNDKTYRQLVTACSSGCKAAIESDKYIRGFS